MREDRSNLVGNQEFAEAVDFWGSITGNLNITDGGKVYLRGNVYGSVLVSDGGRTHIFGQVTGDLVVEKGAKVILEGIVGRDAINRGGRLYVEASAKILGKLKRRDGETHVDSKAQVKE